MGQIGDQLIQEVVTGPTVRRDHLPSSLFIAGQLRVLHLALLCFGRSFADLMVN